MTEKLRVRVCRIGRNVLAQVLEQPERLRSLHSGKLCTLVNRDGYCMYSYIFPGIGEKDLYIRGHDVVNDDFVAAYAFKTEADAQLWIAAMRGMIRKINATGAARPEEVPAQWEVLE